MRGRRAANDWDLLKNFY